MSAPHSFGPGCEECEGYCLELAKLARECGGIRGGSFDAVKTWEFTEEGLTKFATRLSAPRIPPGYALVPVEPTTEMVQAYLDANDAYWRRTDQLPTPPNRWRTGTPKEATAESYRAMLNAAPSIAPGEGGEADPHWNHLGRNGPPPCDGEAVFVGINTAGFACCFNAVTHDGVCSMEGPELSTVQMSGLEWWRALDRPTEVASAGGEADKPQEKA
jgi:hypothetical protein